MLKTKKRPLASFFNDRVCQKRGVAWKLILNQFNIHCFDQSVLKGVHMFYCSVK